MKKFYLFILTLSANIIYSHAQTCLLSKDTITIGEGSKEQQFYYYNSQFDLIKLAKIDSGLSKISEIDTIYYGTNGIDSIVHSYEFVGGWYRYSKKTFTYNINAQIITIKNESSLNNSNYSAYAHDLTHDVNGKISQIELNTASVVGTPEGFTGSLRNVLWNNATNNIATLDLYFGGNTYQLTANFDNKKCLEKKLLAEGAITFIMQTCSNNLESLDFTGTTNKAIHHSFVYNGSNEVISRLENISAFNSKIKETQFQYDNCVTGQNELKTEKFDFETSPNPTNGSLEIKTHLKKFNIDVYNVLGEKIMTGDKNKIDLSNYPKGLYTLCLSSSNIRIAKRIILE